MTVLVFIDGDTVHYLSLVMRKPAFCICENKDADQLRGNREADQRLCFRYMDSTMPLLSKSEIQASWLYSLVCVGLVGNPEDRFSQNKAHLYSSVTFFTSCQLLVN